MYPSLFTTPGVARFAEEIDAERQQQLAKFGDQRHPDGTGTGILRHLANRHRELAEEHAGAPTFTWRMVLQEEVYEALAESDPARLRAELVQVAAVCAAWVSDIDRRPPASAHVQPLHGCPAKHPSLGRICSLAHGHEGAHHGEGTDGRSGVWEGPAS
ncbi:hypothetical protein LG634_24790 [Streptomyces bambusae]|uniref:hypothetical protein n=1 Tax=Streptomyces bambusae TaxID=1550616 RepID=UPI001CFCB405|nr:hypothetical protein [Streptomyces bambusae]MCB5168031.1 hypothetical protein [Streptomyces bambusae]